MTAPGALALAGILAALPAPRAVGATEPASLVTPEPAPTGPPDPAPTAAAGPGVLEYLGLFAAGAATALVAHESCHVVTNLALGNVPHLEPVSFLGVIPYFAISPEIRCVGSQCFKENGQPFGPGRQGLFVIYSAGLQCQQLADEIILSEEPDLRRRDPPFLTGMLTFNTLASIGYVIANWAGIEPPYGDLRGLYAIGAPRTLTNVLFLAVGLMDIARYFFPETPFELLPWASRASKIAVTGLVLTVNN